MELLNLVRDYESQRMFYGPVVLRGEGIDSDHTGIFSKLRSNESKQPIWTEKGLLHGFALSGSKESSSGHTLSQFMWGDVNFSRFAFDLLALLNGTYRTGFSSSFHGFDFNDV